MTVVESRPGSSTPGAGTGPTRRPSNGPASIDLRLRWPLRWSLLVAAIIGAIVANIVVGFVQPAHYEGQVMLAAPKMDSPHPELGIQIVDSRLQSITSLARSEPYLVELARRAGVRTDLDELKRMVTATRPKLGVLITITVSHRDEAVVRALSEQAVPALDEMVDRVREGSMSVLDDEGRNPFADESADYTGPLYIDLFRGTPFISHTEPSIVRTAFSGGGLGALLLIVWALFSHERHIRVTSREELESLLTMPRLGSLRRLGIRAKKEQRDLVRGVALAADGIAGGPSVITVAGAGTRRERATATVALAAGLLATLGRPVLLVDLDVMHGDLSRRCGSLRGLRAIPFLRWAREGVSDAVALHRPAAAMIRTVPRHRVPRAVRSLVPKGDERLLHLPIGTHVGEPAFADDGALGEIVDGLAGEPILVIQLPDVPGPTVVGDVLDRADLNLLVVMDGWAVLDDAMAAAAVLRGAGARSAYLLLDN